MSINTIFVPLLLLLFATRLYAPIKAAANEPNQAQENTNINRLEKRDEIEIDNNDDSVHNEPKSIVIRRPNDQKLSADRNAIIADLLRQNTPIQTQDVINLIIDYAQTPLYIFVGHICAGKSTAIFALQGNEVSRDEESDDDFNSDLGDLTFKKTVEVKTPTIGYSDQEEMVGATIYYPGDTTKNIAFCDTRGFFQSAANLSYEEEFISAFAPSVALKVDIIGGIVVVLSAYDILSENGYVIKKTANILCRYFSSAGHTALRQSILFMITKCKGNKTEVVSALVGMIQKSYQACFRKDKNYPKARYTNTDDTNTAALQPFFAMLLEKQVCQGQENDIKNFGLDNEKTLFFDPCSTKLIENTIEHLSKLQPIPTSHLRNFLKAQEQQVSIANNPHSHNHKVLKNTNTTSDDDNKDPTSAIVETDEIGDTHNNDDNPTADPDTAPDGNNNGHKKESAKANDDNNHGKKSKSSNNADSAYNTNQQQSADDKALAKGNAKLEAQQFNSHQDESSVDNERIHSTRDLLVKVIVISVSVLLVAYYYSYKLGKRFTVDKKSNDLTKANTENNTKQQQLISDQKPNKSSTHSLPNDDNIDAKVAEQPKSVKTGVIDVLLMIITICLAVFALVVCYRLAKRKRQ